jgi:hypothetical protein
MSPFLILFRTTCLLFLFSFMIYFGGCSRKICRCWFHVFLFFRDSPLILLHGHLQTPPPSLMTETWRRGCHIPFERGRSIVRRIGNGKGNCSLSRVRTRGLRFPAVLAVFRGVITMGMTTMGYPGNQIGPKSHERHEWPLRLL